MMPTVSIIMPARNRGHLLGRTLLSIRQQEYPSLEIIVVEDGDDGITQSVASAHGAEYIRSVRSEVYPEWQSLAVIRNLGLRAAKGDIIITQDAEIIHEGSVIRTLVDALGTNHKILAAAKTKLLDEEGNTQSWLSGFVGACPSAVYRETAVAIGGHEEQFFGYGCEDDWYVQLLNWNGVQSRRIDTVAAHQWHPSTPFEPFTGNANRALCWALRTETLFGKRPAHANIGPIIRQSDITPSMLAELLLTVAPKLDGQDDVNAIFDVRNAASAAQNENPESNSGAYVIQQAAESAWGMRWASLCEQAAQTAYPVWASRLAKCREHHLTLSAVAYYAAMRVSNGEIPRSKP